MRDRRTRRLRMAAAFLACSPALPGAAAAAGLPCTPRVEGPIPAGAASPIYFPRHPGQLPAGMAVREYFVSCATSQGAYRTVIHVTTPSDPARQAGVVIAEPWHPGDYFTVFPKTRDYLARTGFSSVAIVASPYVLETYMKKATPSRYGQLHLPGKAGREVAGSTDTTESEVLGQVGVMLKSGAVPGLRADKVILAGMSQTGGVVRKYIGFEHGRPGVRSVYDAYFPEQSALPYYDAPIPDLDVPVIELQGERELIVNFERGWDHLRYRRPDVPLYRLYEVPAMAHIASRNNAEGGIAGCDAHPLSQFPTDMVYAASLDNLVTWVRRGIAAPHIPRISTSADERTIVRDRWGNAVGGYRTTYVDVPIATYHGTWGSYQETPAGPTDKVAEKCNMLGWTAPLPEAALRALYPTHADYMTRVGRDADALVRSRRLLPQDAAALRQEAAGQPVP